MPSSPAGSAPRSPRTTVAVESPRQGEIEALLEQSGSFAASLYPPESNFLLGLEELERPGVSFYVARNEAGAAEGIAALVRAEADSDSGSTSGSGFAELKRMFVSPTARGRGVAGRLLEQIETDAAAAGIRELRLETGPESSGALALYRRLGYREIPLFGQYVGEAHSVCFAKSL